MCVCVQVSVTDNRFVGKSAHPAGVYAPMDGSPLPMLRSAAPEPPRGSLRPSVNGVSQVVGGAVTHSRFNDRKLPPGHTCDGSLRTATRDGAGRSVLQLAAFLGPKGQTT